MTEQRRMEYLDALGIEQYVPRKRLLGAKSSLALIRTHTTEDSLAPGQSVHAPLAHLSPASVAPTHLTSPAQPAPFGEGQAHTLQPVAQIIGQVTERLSPATLAETPAQPARRAAPDTLVPPQKVLRFALTIWQVPGWLWIDSRQSQQALPTDALLHNMLVALNIQEPVKPEIIKWPPVESPLQVQDWAQAREMLSSFLSPRLGPGERLILMGEAAYNACTQGPFDYAERLAAGDMQHPTNPCVLLPSLAQILNQPQLKAHIWRQLQQV